VKSEKQHKTAAQKRFSQVKKKKREERLGGKRKVHKEES
jgi:hypothetical protein